MFGTAEVGKTLGLVFEAERIVNDSCSAFTSNTQPNQHSHSREIAFYKVRGAVKRVNPDHCVLRVESLECVALYFIGAVGFLETVVDKILSLTLVLVQELSGDELFQRVCYLIWFNCWLDILY